MSENVERRATVIAAQLVDVASLTPAPYNTRSEVEYGDIEGLAESIRAEGLLQPITARVLASDATKYEVVCGHRRLRAVQKLGWQQVPAVVRELSDDEARIVAAVDNLHREGINPVAQAAGFRALTRNPFNLAIEEVARRMGKPAWYVRQALDVLELGEKVVAAVRDGHLAWKAVVQVLRIEDLALRQKAAGELLPGRHEGYATVAHARALIFQNYLLQLKDAPFDTADAELVHDAGACGVCPFRSAAKAKQVELFADVKGAEGDTCTKPSCWRSKAEAQHARAEAKAREAGNAVWPNSAKLFDPHSHRGPGQLRHDAGVVDVESVGEDNYELGTSGKRPVRAIAGEHLPAEAVAVVLDPTGRTRYLAKKADVKKALEKAGVKAPSYGGYGGGRLAAGVKSETEKRQDREKRLRNEIRNKTQRNVAEELLAKAAEQKKVVGAVVRVLVDVSPTESRRVAIARGFQDRGGYSDDPEMKFLEKALGDDPQAAIAILAQLAVQHAVGNLDYGFNDERVSWLAKAWGVDAAAIGKAVSTEATARFKEREERRSAAAKKEAKKAKQAKASKAAPAQKAAAGKKAPADSGKAKKAKRRAA